MRLGWAHGDQEIFTRDETIKYFTLDHVGKKGAIFDQQKLDWINGVYIRALADQELLAIIRKDVCPTILDDLPHWHENTILLLINIYKQRAKTLKELVADIKALYNEPASYSQEDIAQWITPTTLKELQEVAERIKQIEPFLEDAISNSIKEFAKIKNIKIVAIAQPLRIALIGKSSGPGVFDLMAVLGKHETINRIEKLISSINK